MQNPIKQLQNLLEMKRKAVAKLFTAYTLQTELEYDLALIRLEFRYDDEVDWTLYEAHIFIITEELKVLDAEIMQLTHNIELYSFQIATL